MPSYELEVNEDDGSVTRKTIISADWYEIGDVFEDEGRALRVLRLELASPPSIASAITMSSLQLCDRRLVCDLYDWETFLAETDDPNHETADPQEQTDNLEQRTDNLHGNTDTLQHVTDDLRQQTDRPDWPITDWHPWAVALALLVLFPLAAGPGLAVWWLATVVGVPGGVAYSIGIGVGVGVIFMLKPRFDASPLNRNRKRDPSAESSVNKRARQ